MSRRGGVILDTPASVPRASGDEPNRLVKERMNATVFPARAGMSRRNIASDCFWVSVPRASGDEPGMT